MLILMRRLNESIMIGDAITVTIMGIEGNRVGLGIKAPKEIPVNREEVDEKIRKEQGLPPRPGRSKKE